MRFSASMLRRWMTCPLQVKFDDIEKREQQQNAKTTFGTVMHHALEYYNKTGDYEGTVERFEYYWQRPAELGAAIDTWPRLTTYGSLLQKGREVLHQFHEKNRWADREIIAAEHKFVVPLGEHQISGLIDLLEIRENSKGQRNLAIVDYKTSARQPTVQDLRLDIQFTFYVYATMQPEYWMGWPGHSEPVADNGEELWNQVKDMDRAPFWSNLWSGKEVFCGLRDDADFMRMYRAITEVVKAVEADVYVPSIRGDSCQWCPYTDVCPVVMPVRDKIGYSFEQTLVF